jgi:quercetin dioxygenase-like cupin family protein
MKITLASDIPAQDRAGAHVQFVATPENGASECVLLRGLVSPGAGFAAHSHDHEEIFYCLSGSCTYEIAGKGGSLSAGDVVVIPAGAIHAIHASEELDAVAVFPAGYKTFAPGETDMAR